MTNEELCLLIQNDQDRQANIEKLYLQNSRLIKSIVKRLKSIDDPEDLEQQGFIEMVRAAESWSPDKDFTFASYATTVIFRGLQRYINNNGNSIHVSEQKKAQIWHIRQIENSYQAEFNRIPSDIELADEMDLSEESIRTLRRISEQLKTSSLDEPIETEEGELSARVDAIADPESEKGFLEVENNIFNDQLAKVLQECLNKLPEQQRIVIDEKYLQDQSSREIAETNSLSLEEVKNSTASGLQNMRRFKYKLKPFWDEYSMGIKGTGVNHFNRTWTSATERAALLILEGPQTPSFDQ